MHREARHQQRARQEAFWREAQEDARREALCSAAALVDLMGCAVAFGVLCFILWILP